MFKKRIYFIKNENGSILLPFITLIPFIIGLLFLSFEISRFIQKKAKLSDAIEQATLALTVENDSNNPNEIQTARNTELVTSYANAYLPSEIFSKPEIEIMTHLTHLEYRATATMSYFPQFLTKSPITNTDKNISMTDNAIARKSLFTAPTEKTDVVFVADYSSSMNGYFNSGDTTTKIEELRRIFKRLNNSILRNDNIKSIGFVPFTWGTKIIIGDGANNEQYCHFPFVPKITIPTGNYLKNSNNYDIDLEVTLAIKNNIDYDETIKSITQSRDFINIPMDDINSEVFCLRYSDAHTLRSDGITNEMIEETIAGKTEGHTLISSGILSGNDIFRNESNNKNKLMIILSDGNDNDVSSDSPGDRITNKLIKKGMCEKIKENNIRMIFIGIGYIPSGIDWKKCVGEGNFYLAKNAHELEVDLRQALGSIEIREVGRNTPKD
ncbi:TadE/TadG family protein [Yersinia sp. LJYL362]|uniref:TadE/TadG family protein n=1 Tax=Yersinia sp. LJYL362 TaxID=3402108 RepID=UPI003AB8B60C